MCRYRNRRHQCSHCEYISVNRESEQLRVKKVARPCPISQQAKSSRWKHARYCLFQVDFIWVTREQRSLEWFISLLAQMEIEQQHLKRTSDDGCLLEVHLYVTSATSPADLKALNVYLSLNLNGRESSAHCCDAIDGIRQRTKHGRPDWDQVTMNFYSNVNSVNRPFLGVVNESMFLFSPWACLFSMCINRHEKSTAQSINNNNN
jgi:hypothetical protein